MTAKQKCKLNDLLSCFLTWSPYLILSCIALRALTIWAFVAAMLSTASSPVSSRPTRNCIVSVFNACIQQQSFTLTISFWLHLRPCDTPSWSLFLLSLISMPAALCCWVKIIIIIWLIKRQCVEGLQWRWKRSHQDSNSNRWIQSPEVQTATKEPPLGSYSGTNIPLNTF